MTVRFNGGRSVFSLFIVSCGKSGNSDIAINLPLKLVGAKIVASTDTKWENNQNLIISFLDGTDAQKMEVELFAKEWTKYANIDFSFYPSQKTFRSVKDQMY